MPGPSPKSPTLRKAPRASRRSPHHGYARGDKTRRRIIEAAIEVFGTLGFEGASTRVLARRARVNLPALQYYFGGKSGLHQACVEYITADFSKRLEPAAKHAKRALARPELTSEQLLTLLRTILNPFIDGLATNRPQSWLLFFTRAQIEREPSSAVFDQVGEQIIGLCAAIVGHLLDLPPGSPDAVIRSAGMVGQVMLLHRARPLILRRLGWPDLEGRRLAHLKEVLWQSISASLQSAPR